MTAEDASGHWLARDTQAALAWQREQDAAAESALRGWPGYGWLRERISEHRPTVTSAPQQRGGHWFRTEPSGEGQRLVVSEEPLAEGRALVDTVELMPGRRGSLDWFSPAPDGGHVAFGLSADGDEQSVLHVVRTADAHLLDERIPHCSVGVVAWLPDASGFWFNRGQAADTSDADKWLCLHILGEAPRAVDPLAVREQYSVFPQVSADGRFLAAVTSELDVRPDYLKHLPDGPWEPFLRDVAGQTFGAFHGDAYIAVTTHLAPRGRLVRIPVANGSDPSTWSELCPESEAVMRSVEVIGDRLVVTSYDDTWSRVDVLALDGTPLCRVPLPGDGVVLARAGCTQPAWPGHGLHVSPGDDCFTFVFSSLVQSPSLHLFDLRSGELQLLVPPATVRTGVHVATHLAYSADGREVPYHVIRDEAAPQPGPTVVFAYGGWNIAFLPGWYPVFQPLIEVGGTLVLAHLRGGGELGESFWHEGRLELKQNTFNDVYAVAEDLVRRELTTTDQLGLVGGSNGGLLVGAVVTQRPELFRAAVCLVPVLDMLAFDRDPYARTSVREYGDPQDPAARVWLGAYSPNHHVAPAAYPATLVHCGANDMRCPSWHGRTFAGLLQESNQGELPILFRAAADGGHLTCMSPSFGAEWLGFLMQQLGLEGQSA